MQRAADEFPHPLLKVIEKRIFVVVSQDRDVANFSLEKEPLVEIIIGTINAAADGSYLYNKSVRRSHVRCRYGGTPAVAEFQINDRLSFPRRLLAMEPPDGNLIFERDAVRQMATWIGRRYARVAFPDAFNRRVERGISCVRDQLKRGAANAIDSIFVEVNPDDRELSDGESYRIVVIGTVVEKVATMQEVWDLAVRHFALIEGALNGCPGITVNEAKLLSEAEVSLATIRGMKRFDFDDLSLRENPPSFPTPSAL